ncbi:hypothetical protein BCR44DRAFT_27142 [Catenaria anguillulae PL171]|uniref:Uncharacterized protein n=1 Tax=Catenaria anguillulae PL171 TaxID=765915 RepID=A0A1Y2HRU1_9FUNG|nr:hypothetical protein BCR44DRAFT_27142 [Catenaria anguillulae PL171]
MGQVTHNLNAAKADGLWDNNQEIQRIIDELEHIYTMSHSDWLQADPIATFLCAQLGYEDIAELEDALQRDWHDFLKMLPTIETEMRPLPAPEGSDPATDAAAAATASGQLALYFRVIPEPDQAHWVPKKMTYHINQRPQLWNVLLKSAHARLEVPALGLEFSADGRKRVDTVWNFLSQAALDLGMHVQSNVGFSDADTDKTVAVIEGLAALRDVDYPWDLVIIDPSGTSKFTDMSLVQVEDNHVDTGRMVDEE